MKVPMLDPVRCNKTIQKELETAAIEVLRSGQFILGEKVRHFEESCATYLGVKHAIGVSSGTDALLLSLMASGIGPGDEVICPSFTFFATAGSIARTGATPVFVDILDSCFTCNALEIAKAVTKKTKAIIPVHLFGQCADMDSIMEIAKHHNLLVIEDAAQAIGAEHKGVKAGALGDIGCFSFFPSKNLGGFGDAGLITTNNDDLADKIRIQRVHGGHARYFHSKIGGNFRIDALQAALLDVKLKHLSFYQECRRQNAEYYKQALAHSSYVLPFEIDEMTHVYNQFTIRVKPERRDRLVECLSNEGISTGIYYPLPLHQQKCFSYLKTKKLPVTELTCKSCLSIPIASEITADELEHVAVTLVNLDKDLSK